MMRNSFQNRHSQKFLHRPRYNLPDCLLEDQCRCNSMFLLPQWHLINAKVEPSWCSSHIQVHDARFQEYFLRVIVLHYSASTSSRLANLLNCPQRRFQMNSVVLNIETDLKKTIDCTNHPIFVPNLDLSNFFFLILFFFPILSQSYLQILNALEDEAEPRVWCCNLRWPTVWPVV